MANIRNPPKGQQAQQLNRLLAAQRDRKKTGAQLAVKTAQQKKRKQRATKVSAPDAREATQKAPTQLVQDAVKKTVKDVVQDAVKQQVKDVVKNAVKQKVKDDDNIVGVAQMFQAAQQNAKQLQRKNLGKAVAASAARAATQKLITKQAQQAVKQIGRKAATQAAMSVKDKEERQKIKAQTQAALLKQAQKFARQQADTAVQGVGGLFQKAQQQAQKQTARKKICDKLKQQRVLR